MFTSFKMCDLKSSLDFIHVFGDSKKSHIFKLVRHHDEVWKDMLQQ